MNAEMASMAFKMVTALGATLLVFGVAIMIFKKVQASGGLKGLGKMATKRSPKGIEIVHQSGLGPGRMLHVIRCSGKTLLVGSTNHGISLISDLGEELDDDTNEVGSTFGSTLLESLREKGSLKRQVSESLENVSRV